MRSRNHFGLRSLSFGLFWLGQAAALTVFLCVGIKFFRECAMTRVRIREVPPKEARHVSKVMRFSISDAPMNPDPFNIISNQLPLRSVEGNVSYEPIIHSFVWTNKGIVQSVAFRILVDDDRVIQSVLRFRRIEYFGLAKVVFNVSRTHSEVSEFNFESKRGQRILQDVHWRGAARWRRFGKIDNLLTVSAGYSRLSNQEEWPVYVQSGFRSAGALFSRLAHLLRERHITFSCIGGFSSLRKSIVRNFGLLADFVPLQARKYQIAKADDRQSDVDQHRWRAPSFFIGLCLFLGSFGLLFYSCDRFSESNFRGLPNRKWYLGLLLLNWLGGSCGIALMLIGPRIF